MQRRIGGRSRAHAALFHSAWIILLAAAASLRFSLPLTPAIDRDFSGYLQPALLAQTGHGFAHLQGRASLYPGMVNVLLTIFRDFRAITVFQHALGLATGLLLLATWCAAWRALPAARIPRWLYDLAGLAMTAVFLFAAQPVQFEFLVRPDVICPFFAALSFFLLVRFLLAWRVERNSRAMFCFAIAAVFISFVLPSLKPSFWLSSILTTIPVWVALFDRRESPAHRFGMAAIPLAAVCLFLVIPERLAARGDQSSATFLPESLFSIHALIIREQIAADISAPDPAVPYPPEKLRETLALLDAGIASAQLNGPRHMASLGCDADWLLYRDPFFIRMAEAEHWAVEPRLSFYRYYYRRTWMQQSIPMLRKVAIQLGLFYNLECPAYCNHGYDMGKYYARADEILQRPEERAIFDAWEPARAYRASVAVLKDRVSSIPVRKVLRLTIDRLGNFYLPGLIAWLVAVPWVCWRGGRRAHFGVFAAILGVGYAFNFGNNLGIAILHTLEVVRYSQVQFATTLLTEMLAFFFLAEVMLAVGAPLFRRQKTVPITGAPPAGEPRSEP